MGRKRDKREAFLRAHSICIFCGGTRRSAEEDHVPGRVFFSGRHWPEGYVFPACSSCNRASRADEQLLAFIALLNDPASRHGLTPEWHARKQALANNFPEVYRALLPTARDVRSILQKYELERIRGIPLHEHPFVKLPADTVGPAIQRYGFKLGAALHYRHTGGRIIPHAGGVLTHFWTNLDLATQGLPSELMTLVPFQDRVVRQRMELSEQFEVRAGWSEDLDFGVYVARFRAAFTLIHIVATDLSVLIDGAEEIGAAFLGCPFSWPRHGGQPGSDTTNG